MILALAIVLGAAWRRWWGDVVASWWPWRLPNGDGRFYRGFQAIVGLAVLFGLCLWAGHTWWSAALRAGLAIGFLTAMAESIPHVWRFWDWVDLKVISLRSRFRLIDGFTTYAEMTAGALVFGLAVAI